MGRETCPVGRQRDAAGLDVTRRRSATQPVYYRAGCHHSAHPVGGKRIPHIRL